ncbi:olfactory receptor 2W3-like [Puma concolor]|uniref:Olfactory receptor 2W3-like n=1 Tax=Puma concolor TaxID=9696 RepID=A0A6P6HKR9_PUMCO|nr:olfactory receptor 2W3-like [Puma concolor]
MDGTNDSTQGNFILLGFSDHPHLERILFVVILIAYLLTLVGNTTIILVSRLDPHLHTPMYFFLTHVGIVLSPLVFILVSYGYIVRAVLQIQPVSGRQKAFNTCGSHLTVVSLFYGNIIYMYMQPGNSSSQDQSKFLTLFYNIVTPLLNPLIYTLRNKEVKGALRRMLLDNRGVGKD